MYEPRHLPNINEKISACPEIRFGIIHKKEFINCDDTTIDPLHIHGYIEIFFSISSDVSFLVNNNLYRINDGDAIISLPNDIHMCLFNRTRMHEYVCLWIDCPQNLPLVDFLFADTASPHLCLDKSATSQLQELLVSLAQTDITAENELVRTSLLFRILALLKTGAVRTHVKPLIPEYFQRVLDYINENFAQIRYVSELFDVFFVSPATLNRWFRRYIRLSAREYIESKKLAYAAALLSKGENVTEASIKSGFCDCSHFIRLFKKSFGETPLKYKQRQKQP